MDEAPLRGAKVRTPVEYPKVKIPQYLAAHSYGIAGISLQLSCRGLWEEIASTSVTCGRGGPLA